MADANLKVPSEERIRVSASESIINAVSPRVDISTITGGHRVVITDIDGTESMDVMDGAKGDKGNKGDKGDKGDTGAAAGFGTVSASVDNNVGTPSVTVTSSGPNTAKNFDISFKNLKGIKGDTGVAAGFDTPTASVDGYIGTPSVAVTATGPATAKKFNFAFHNLKGEKGDTGSIESLIVDGSEPEEGAGVSVDGPISELSAEGWAEQFSTTGKNLLPNNVKSRTINGVTFTANVDKSVTVSGTATSLTQFPLLNNSLKSRLVPFDGGNTYVLSGGATNVDVAMWMYSDDAYIGFANSRNNPRSISYPNATSFTPLIEVPNGVTVNATVYPQLELGSTATEYEPYTGGAPSPSPDYPQEIEVAKGRNLLDESTFTVNSWMDKNGEVQQGNSYSTTDYIEVKGGFIYSLDLFTNDSVTTVMNMCWYDSNKSFISYTTRSRNAPSSQMTAPSNAKYLKCTLASILQYQLTEGSTPQPYVPYGYVGMEVYGKNLFTIPEKSEAGLTVTVDSDGAIRLDGTPTRNLAIEYTFQELVPAGTYTIKARASALANVIVRVGLSKGGYNVPSSVVAFRESTEPEEKTFTTEAYTYPVLYVYSGQTFSNYKIYVQLEAGTEATTYEPYHHTTTPIPLPERGWVGSLPDGTADILHLDGAGKVEWEKKTWEVVLDGSSDENWMTENNNYRVKYRILNCDAKIAPKPTGSDNMSYGYCSHFVQSTPGRTWWASGGFCFAYTFDRTYGLASWYFSDGKKSMNINDWITFIQANPITVFYALAEPQTESLGYIDLPDIPAGSTVSIPELDALGISYYVDNGAVRKLAKQYEERIETTAIQPVEDSVVELASILADFKSIFEVDPAASHKSIYRGKNLGTSLTAAQKATIASGRFDDLWVGDYWTINGRVYRIADIDYYYNSGDTAFTKHHLVIVPDANFGNGPMNDTNTTDGAYVGSKMYTDSNSVLNTARTTIANNFGDALATHRVYLHNATTSGYASAGAWYDSTVELMNEPMVYGSYIFTPGGNGSMAPNRGTAEKSQLALFRLNYCMINIGRYWYWLRDVVSTPAFAYIGIGGSAGSHGASNSNGVRPSFCIVGS